MTDFLARLFWQVLDRAAYAATLARLRLVDLRYQYIGRGRRLRRP